MNNLTEVIQDYIPDDDIMNDEGENLTRLKHIIFDKLTEPERRILLTYAEMGSLRKVGKEYGVSAFTVYQKIRKIRNKIYAELGFNSSSSLLCS